MGTPTKRSLIGALSATGLAGLLAGFFAWLRRRCCDATVGAWDEDPNWGDDGSMTNVADFRSFVEDRRPCWRHYPVASAFAIIGIDPTDDAPMDTVAVDRAPSAGSGEVDVTLTYDVEGDDSVAAIRYRFTFVDVAFVGGSSGTYRLVHGLREFRCQSGRGQTDWGPELCL